MDTASISQCYQLKSLAVTPSQLLVDPNNPRIVLKVDHERKFTEDEIARPDTQQYILSIINKEEYHLANLIRSIRSSGFIDMGADMIVKRLPGSKQFLVLEGNRRTAAIRHLLNDRDRLPRAVSDTLRSLKVKEFVYRVNNEFAEDAVVDILLGSIHITGRLGWGALEKAHYIYNSYRRELRKQFGDVDFRYVIPCSREVANYFNLAVRGVRKQLIVYRVYEQLKTELYRVQPSHFSLIEMAISDRRLSRDYFRLDDETFHFAHDGLEKFDQLCIQEDRPVHNPGDFRTFSNIFKNGTDYDIRSVESRQDELHTIWNRIRARLHKHEFLQRLEDIEALLNSLEPASFRGNKKELERIGKIRELVETRLAARGGIAVF